MTKQRKEETTLYFTHCKKCKKDYLVGIDGRDITKSKTSGGEMHLAIGNDEIDKAPKLPLYTDCKNCGETCKIDEVKSK